MGIQSLENIDNIVVPLNGRESPCAALERIGAGQPFGWTDGIRPPVEESMALAAGSLLNSRAEAVAI